MKEFITAVEDIEAEDEREAKIVALMGEKDLSREDAEAQIDGTPYVEFKIDDRVLRAYRPDDGQLAFMLAALGRGQSAEKRFAAIINVMMSSLRDADQDYFEERLLERDRKKKIPMKTIEGVFEYLTEEWFREDLPGGGEPVQDRV